MKACPPDRFMPVAYDGVGVLPLQYQVLRIRSQTAEKRAARLEEELEDQKRQVLS